MNSPPPTPPKKWFSFFFMMELENIYLKNKIRRGGGTQCLMRRNSGIAEGFFWSTHTKKVGKKRRNLKREEPERGGGSGSSRNVFYSLGDTQWRRGGFKIVSGGKRKKKKETSLYIFTTPAFGKQENAPMFGTWESCPFNTIIYFFKKKNVFFSYISFRHKICATTHQLTTNAFQVISPKLAKRHLGFGIFGIVCLCAIFFFSPFKFSNWHEVNLIKSKKKKGRR